MDGFAGTYTRAMTQRNEFALTVSKSKDGRDWQTVSEGHWTPPDAATLTGEILPDPVLEKLSKMEMKRFGDGGTHNVKYGEWYYRFDLLRR
jgi:hypothetical protein